MTGKTASPVSLTADLTAFRQYLQAERGMSKNTVLAYGRDLGRFAGWLAEGGLKDYLARRFESCLTTLVS